MADSEKAKLYQRVTQAPDWWVLERMQLHGYWPEHEGLPPDPPDELAERQQLEKEIAQLREQDSVNIDPDEALKQERVRRLKESRERREQRKKERAQQAAARRERWLATAETTIVHAGDGHSAGLQQTLSDTARLERLGLPTLHRSEELADAMGIELATLRWLTFHRRGAALVHYRRYDIDKKTGGVRNISAPRPALASAQCWVFENILSPLDTSDAAHGFVKQRSIVSNAAPHVGQKIVINMDMENFFPSITFRRVKGLFCQLGYSEHLAVVLALLCTEPPRVAVEHAGKVMHVAIGDRVLPQGACTSPAITNLICRKLDARLKGFSEKIGFTYTRYADDLTFSGNDSSKVGKVLRMSRQVLSDEGFKEHPTKTRIMRRGRRQEVTGVVVNEKPAVGRREYRRLRAILHNAAKHGLESQNRSNHPAFAEHLRGQVAFVQMIDPAKGAKLKADLDKVLGAR